MDYREPATDSRLRRLALAADHLDAGRPDEALRVLGEPDPACVVSRGVLLAARGLIHEREGDAVEADACFDEVFRLGTPLPALLAQSGSYFKRAGRYDRSYQCHSILQNVRPNAMNDFLQGLPSSEVARYSPWWVKHLLTKPQPGFYALQPIKEAMVSELGDAEAALTFAQLAGLAQSWSVARLPTSGLHSYARLHAAVYEEVIASKDIELPPAPVFGRPGAAPIRARTRSMYFCVLADVIVASKSNFLLVRDRALLDVEDEELQRTPLNVDVDPMVFAPRDKAATFLLARPSPERLELERALSLTGVHSFNFGHWLLEFLPKVFACIGRPGFQGVPILVDEQMPQQHREALELFLGADHPVVVLERTSAVHVKELWVCSSVSYLPLGPKPGAPTANQSGISTEALTLDPEGFASLIERVRPVLARFDQINSVEPRALHPRRIYLTRRDSQHRRLLNRLEVEAWFVDRGFEVYDFGAVSFRDQIALARGSDVIVGADGSSNLITFFARPGTRVGVLTNTHAEDNEWYALVCRALGQPLSIVAGETEAGDPRYRQLSDYRIDLDVLAAFMDHLLSGS